MVKRRSEKQLRAVARLRGRQAPVRASSRDRRAGIDRGPGTGPIDPGSSSGQRIITAQDRVRLEEEAFISRQRGIKTAPTRSIVELPPRPDRFQQAREAEIDREGKIVGFSFFGKTVGEGPGIFPTFGGAVDPLGTSVVRRRDDVKTIRTVASTDPRTERITTIRPGVQKKSDVQVFSEGVEQELKKVGTNPVGQLTIAGRVGIFEQAPKVTGFLKRQEEKQDIREQRSGRRGQFKPSDSKDPGSFIARNILNIRQKAPPSKVFETAIPQSRTEAVVDIELTALFGFLGKVSKPAGKAIGRGVGRGAGAIASKVKPKITTRFAKIKPKPKDQVIIDKKVINELRDIEAKGSKIQSGEISLTGDSPFAKTTIKEDDFILAGLEQAGVTKPKVPRATGVTKPPKRTSGGGTRDSGTGLQLVQDTKPTKKVATKAKPKRPVFDVEKKPKIQDFSEVSLGTRGKTGIRPVTGFKLGSDTLLSIPLIQTGQRGIRDKFTSKTRPKDIIDQGIIQGQDQGQGQGQKSGLDSGFVGGLVTGGIGGAIVGSALTGGGGKGGQGSFFNLGGSLDVRPGRGTGKKGGRRPGRGFGFSPSFFVIGSERFFGVKAPRQKGKKKGRKFTGFEVRGL